MRGRGAIATREPRMPEGRANAVRRCGFGPDDRQPVGSRFAGEKLLRFATQLLSVDCLLNYLKPVKAQSSYP